MDDEKELASRRADQVMFGFEFQVNAAIILMLRNIKSLDTIRIEGNYEDIELQLTDGEKRVCNWGAVIFIMYVQI